MTKKYIDIPLVVYDIKSIRNYKPNSSVINRFLSIFSCGQIKFGIQEDVNLGTNQIIIKPVVTQNMDTNQKSAQAYALTEVKLYLPNSTDKFVSDKEARFFLIYTGKDDKENFDLIIWDSEENPTLCVSLKSK